MPKDTGGIAESLHWSAAFGVGDDNRGSRISYLVAVRLGFAGGFFVGAGSRSTVGDSFPSPWMNHSYISMPHSILELVVQRRQSATRVFSRFLASRSPKLGVWQPSTGA